MEFSAKQIAEFLQGTVEGNPDVMVHDVSRIEAGVPGTLSFLSNPKYTNYIYTTEASVVLVNKTFEAEQEVPCTLIRVENSYEALAQLLQLQESLKPKKTGVSSLAYIAETAKLGENVYVGPFAYIGEHVVIGSNAKIYPQVFLDDYVQVGEDTTIMAGVRVGDRTKIGNRVILQPGCAIGFDGFGFVPQPDGHYEKLPQTGNVVIEDDVEIQCNTCVDRSTMGSTVISKGVKLDNLIQIAHNVTVGENTVMASQCGIAGSTHVGKQCVFGGQTGVVGHIHIADGAQFGAKTGINTEIKEGGAYMGYPVVPLRQWQRNAVVGKKLYELLKK